MQKFHSNSELIDHGLNTFMRIDPLKKDGTIDTDFFGSDEYSTYVTKLKWYLKQEGFEALEEQIVITIMNHTWLVRPATYH